MSRAQSTSKAAITAGPGTGAAVLYVCAERGRPASALAADRARQEGHAFADARGLHITDVITDPYGEADPLRRAGWRLVRGMAQTRAVTTVITRWPAAIAPDCAHDLRHREIRWLRELGVRVCYTWAPLAACGGEAR